LLSQKNSREVKYVLSIKVPRSLLEEVEGYIEYLSLAMVTEINGSSSVNTYSKDNKICNLKLYLDSLDSCESAKLAIRTGLIEAGHPMLEIETDTVPNIDWVEKYQRESPALKIADFYLYQSHISPPLNEQKSILINASNAFGSGDHPTTKACLLTIQKLSSGGFKPKRVLDIGTGSGILAVASAITWMAHVTAVDNDAVSVRVAKRTVIEDKCSNKVRVIFSDGLSASDITRAQQYDLILANIFSRSLKLISKTISKKTKQGGYVVLSGLLESQAEEIIHVYQNVGLNIDHSLDIDGWKTLVLKKIKKSIN